jgi:hypothetical protein
MKAYHLITGQVYDSNAPVPESPEPKYQSFEEFLEKVPIKEIRKWCQNKASKANRARLMSGPPEHKITADLVMNVLFKARGRCYYCGSLCVERAPIVDGKLAPWAHVGRRIGSLTHVISPIEGGDNVEDNLKWCCNWCNTWPDQRIFGAADHGGIQTIDEKNTDYLIKAITAEIERVFPNGFEGVPDEYQWLLKHYGISEEEDSEFITICEYMDGTFEEEEMKEIRNNPELFALLSNPQAVNRFLVDLLKKYKSRSDVYPSL